MTAPGGFKETWLRPFFYLGRNRLSLIGGALTSAAAFILIGFWVVEVFGHGGPSNPYIGIIVDVFLPAMFVLGLLLIPAGIWWRRRHLETAAQLPSAYPEVDFKDPMFRRALDYVVVATFVNFVIVGTASYRAVSYMDTPSFCGTSCHVMAPEWSAYHVSSHAGVACTDCHIAPGVAGFVHAKVNGTKQLFEVMFNKYPRPISAENKIPEARVTCLNCHNATANIGDRVLSKTSYGDDEKNSITHTLLVLHVGGSDRFAHLSGIHGAHLGHIQYVPTDPTRQTIPWVGKVNIDGSTKEFVSTDTKGPSARPKRMMDCIDCHNRASHSFQTPEDALNKAMAEGSPSPSLPFGHKEGLALIKATYTSQVDAQVKIRSGLETFYKSQYPEAWEKQRPEIERSASTLIAIYGENVFPFMKVAWGSHPNNIGHNSYPGCFRCHDGSHTAKDGSSITNDCTVCHNLVAVDEANPKQLAELGLQ